jgi:nitroreductase
VVEEALTVALQAPSGSNLQSWHWIVITDPSLRRRVAELYARSYEMYSAGTERTDETARRVGASSRYLADTMAEVPVLVIGAIEIGCALPEGNQSSIWGSLLPGAWSFSLALRARGLGSAWTTLHLAYEREIADLLGIPEGVHQGVLLPVAYTKGTDFKPAGRRPLAEVMHLDGW